MIAPEPFFEPRGTPFSEFHRIRALTALGHQVDLVTYPFGQTVSMPGLRVFRSLRPPFVSRVKIGPSLAKIPLDALLALTATRRAFSGQYDVIHSHEEGGLIGAMLAAVKRVPHLYDMHSSLPQQLSNFAFSRSGVIKQVVSRDRALHDSPIAGGDRHLPGARRDCQGDRARRADRADRKRARLGGGCGDARSCRGRTPRASVSSGSTPVVLYTGTFEAYQGLDLLFAAMAIVRRGSARRAAIAGRWTRGSGPNAARIQARAAGIEDVTIFAGERPAQEIPAYLLMCDALVSPRSRGTNTPLKIYQYLRSGKPIVATRLLTHTQVLSDDTAILTGASPDEYAAGILAALSDPDRAARVGRQARELAETKYSYEAYLAKTRQACDALMPPPQRRRGQGRRVKEQPARDHYSYTHYADRSNARSFDDRRFGGVDRRAGGGDAGAGADEHDRPDSGSPHSRRRHRHWPGGVVVCPRRRPRHRRRRVGGNAGDCQAARLDAARRRGRSRSATLTRSISATGVSMRSCRCGC